MELSHFGAKVIYPPTIQPVLKRNIPVRVKNTFAPGDEGTLIDSSAAQNGNIIRGITSINNIALLGLEGSGMVGIPGFSKRLFEALAGASINVIMITQGSSEHSICVAVEESYTERAKESIDKVDDGRLPTYSSFDGARRHRRQDGGRIRDRPTGGAGAEPCQYDRRFPCRGCDGRVHPRSHLPEGGI